MVLKPPPHDRVCTVFEPCWQQREVGTGIMKIIERKEKEGGIDYVLLHGQPDTGKSYLIHALHNSLKNRCVMSATTAAAAANIGGDTIHKVLCPPAQHISGNSWPKLKMF